MVKVYNKGNDPDDMIKIIVLPNTKEGKEVYDFAIELLEEEIG